jgi:hypothetical protein
MSQNIAVEALITERDNMLSQFNEDIAKLESAIEQISGKKVWEIVTETRYDDENPHYIKGSQEEM